MSITTCYIGVDPGESGGIVAIWGDTIVTTPMLESEGAICNWLTRLKRLVLRKHTQQAHKGNALGQPLIACIEEQQPRPTYFTDNGGQKTHSILRSTCILYGNYRMMVGILTALDIQVEKVLPRKWQKEIQAPTKLKTDSQHDWKKKLKTFAETLYPEIKVTLAISDALLLCEYCILKYGTIPNQQETPNGTQGANQS